MKLELWIGREVPREVQPPVGSSWVVYCCVGRPGGQPRECVFDPSVEVSAPLRGCDLWFGPPLWVVFPEGKAYPL